MKAGRRIANPASKALAGTYRKDRHGDIAPISTVPATAPVMPQGLSQAAQTIWTEEARRVATAGTTEADSSLFARYCEMEAWARAAFAGGELPKLALLTELRRVGELLGIAGARSRLAHTGKTEPAKASPFAAKPIAPQAK